MSKILSGTVTGCTNLTAVIVQDSHTGGPAQAVVECINTSLGIGDDVSISIGYTGDTSTVFTGFVKVIEQKVPDNTYVITCNDVLVRSVDFFIASSDPNAPFSRSNISAENLVGDLMALAGLTNYTSEATSFTFGVVSPVEVNLVSVYDFTTMIADLLAFHIWADTSGQVHFEDRKPYVMGGDTSVATLTVKTRLSYRESERDLRNRVVVYGISGVYAEASAVSPYLPAGFYKAVVLATEIIQSNTIAQSAADFNLELLNRLTKQTSLTVEGDPQLRARDIVTVADTFTGISGDWYIFAIEHRWGSQGYTTSMELRQ